MATRRRPQKKSSNNGIWVGTGISLAIICLISVALFFKFQAPPPDSVSGAITEKNLAKQTLQTDGLPNLGSAPGGSGSLSDLLSTIAEGKNYIRSGGYEEEAEAASKKIIQSLHGAAASSIPANSFDQLIPEKRFESRELKQDLQVLGKAVNDQIRAHNDNDEFDEAKGIAISYLTLGKQVYEKNDRLKVRQRGLAMMRNALSKIDLVNYARFEAGEIDKTARTEAKALTTEWENAIKALEDVWNSKLEAIEAVNRPNTADIIKVANEDKDRTFRAYATLRLGYVLYERGDEGNQETVKEAIEALKSDSDKLVASAANQAASIKRDEYHELRK